MEVMIWLLTGGLSLITILSGTIWHLIREEAREQSALIKQKADSDRLTDAEDRWKSELLSVKEGNEKLVNKLEARHDKEMDALATRLGEQIKTTENNILTQLRLVVEVLRAEKE